MREISVRHQVSGKNRRKRVSVFLISVSLTAWVATANAQDQSTQFQSDARPNGFYLTSPLEISEGYDSGLVAGTTRLNDYETLLTAPTFAWFRENHRTEFELNYDPEFEIFSHNSRLNSWNHASTMRLTHRINARWSLIGGNSFLSTSDPGRSLGNSLVLLPRGEVFAGQPVRRCRVSDQPGHESDRAGGRSCEYNPVARPAYRTTG